jgi:hypothetical protein
MSIHTVVETIENSTDVASLCYFPSFFLKKSIYITKSGMFSKNNLKKINKLVELIRILELHNRGILIFLKSNMKGKRSLSSIADKSHIRSQNK